MCVCVCVCVKKRTYREFGVAGLKPPTPGAWVGEEDIRREEDAYGLLLSLWTLFLLLLLWMWEEEEEDGDEGLVVWRGV